MRSFMLLYLASIREFRRDVTAMFWTFAFPLMFMLLFGVIFSNEDSVSFDVGVVNEGGAAAQPIVEAFQRIDAFSVTVGERKHELDALKDGDRQAVIIIPAETAQTLGAYFAQTAGRSGSSGGESGAPEPAALDVYYDPGNQTTAQVLLRVIDQVVSGVSQGMTGVSPVLTTQSHTITANDLRYIDFFMPGVLGMTLMQLGLFATAAPLVSLRERKVLRRMGATPLKRTTLLATQVVFRLTIAAVQTAVIVAVARLVFDVRLEPGNLLGVIGMVMLGATMFITLGYFLSTLAKTDEAVQGIIQFPNMIFMFLSGVFFPLDFMPEWIRPVANAIPLTYLVDALRQLMVGMPPVHSMSTNVVALAVWLVACAGLAIRFFRWE